MPNCMIDDENPIQGGEPGSAVDDQAEGVKQQSERITALALAYQAEQRAKGRDISLTTAIIEIVTVKDQ